MSLLNEQTSYASIDDLPPVPGSTKYMAEHVLVAKATPVSGGLIDTITSSTTGTRVRAPSSTEPSLYTTPSWNVEARVPRGVAARLVFDGTEVDDGTERKLVEDGFVIDLDDRIRAPGCEEQPNVIVYSGQMTGEYYLPVGQEAIFYTEGGRRVIITNEG